MSFSSLSPLLLSVLTYSSILGPPAIPVCGLEIILPTVFKSFLKQESMGLVGTGVKGSLRSKLSYGLFRPLFQCLYLIFPAKE